MTKRVDLQQRYRAEIEAADWGEIRKNAEENPQWADGAIVGGAFLGSVTRLFPSGKIWTLWTSNQSWQDMVRDTVYREALESVANEHGMFIDEFSGDIFACIFLDEGYEAIVWCDRDRRDYPHSGFYKGGKLVARTGFELAQHMDIDIDGFFPSIYLDSGYGSLSRFSDWQDADGYKQDGEDYPIEDFQMMAAYVECMLWVSSDDEDTPLDQLYSGEDLDSNARATVYRDCADFLRNPLVQQALDSGAWSPEQLGHDFCLTRNGHGTGFWARGEGELGDKLTELCRPYGEQYAYPYDTDGGDTLIGLSS